MSGTVIPGGPRSPAELADSITIKQDGNTVLQAANALNFIGATVAEDGHGQASVTITGGGGAVVTNDTLTGNGTGGSPLGVDTANLAGLVAVDHDATLTGDGTSGNHLGINPGHVAVVTDGTTITGDGTSGNHLVVNVGGLTGLVAVDTDTTLTGNGTAGSHLGINPGHVPVVSDGVTITGDGTTGAPLTATGGGGGGVNVLDADSTVVAGASGIRFLGTPVTVTVDGIDPTVADVTITVPAAASFTVTLPADLGTGFVPGQVGYQDPALSHRFTPAANDEASETSAQVVGMCTQAQIGATQVVCVAGPVTLTAPQWAAVIAEGGPLVEGIYYLAESAPPLGGPPGSITAVKPTTSGSYITVVGYAIRLNGAGSTLTFIVRPEAAILIP